jgi:hypothetical protein
MSRARLKNRHFVCGERHLCFVVDRWLLEDKLSPRPWRGKLNKSGSGSGDRRQEAVVSPPSPMVQETQEEDVKGYREEGRNMWGRTTKLRRTFIHVNTSPSRCPPIHTAASPPCALERVPRSLPSTPIPDVLPGFSHDCYGANQRIRALRRACECGIECSTYSTVQQGLLQAVLTPLGLVGPTVRVRR